MNYILTLMISTPTYSGHGLSDHELSSWIEKKPVKMATASGREKMPFIIETIAPSGSREEIQVLGTHFNVSAYGNENNVRTSLLEGSVKFSSNNLTVIITPGEQAVLGNTLGKASVAKADVAEEVA